MTFSFHCHSSISLYSGGQRYVIQLGCVSLGDPPGQPENPTMTGTSIFSASSTVCRNDSASLAACLASGWTGLPWQLKVATRILCSSNFFFQALAFPESARSSATGQWFVPGYPP